MFDGIRSIQQRRYTEQIRSWLYSCEAGSIIAVTSACKACKFLAQAMPSIVPTQLPVLTTNSTMIKGSVCTMRMARRDCLAADKTIFWQIGASGKRAQVSSEPAGTVTFCHNWLGGFTDRTTENLTCSWRPRKCLQRAVNPPLLLQLQCRTKPVSDRDVGQRANAAPRNQLPVTLLLARRMRRMGSRSV